MSGGVDSSVAALLMKKAGYEVIGVFMKNWSDTKDPITGECSWREERRMAMKIAAKLKIPFTTVDSEKQYKKHVVNPMFKLYKKGITPNQDVDCNQKIKFPILIKTAKKLKADYLVTGHYARIKQNKKTKKYELLRSKDESKDQSYFLYRLSQDDLKNSLFPIGKYSKKEIREIAKKNNFQNYDKKGTVGICFIGKINLKQFLQKKIKPKKGKILDPNGNQIGEHDGIYYYTIGQRIGPRYGIEISKNSDNKKQLKRWYVAKKDLRTNTIIAAPEGHKLNYKKNIIVKQPHFISTNEKEYKTHTIKKPLKIHSRIRNVGELLPSRFLYNKKSKQFEIILNKPINGVSEGQAIVIYKPKSSLCLGGGVIGF